MEGAEGGEGEERPATEDREAGDPLKGGSLYEGKTGEGGECDQQRAPSARDQKTAPPVHNQQRVLPAEVRGGNGGQGVWKERMSRLGR